MSKNYILTFEKPKLEPKFGDYVEYSFPYSIVESQYRNQPDEGLYLSKQEVAVRASGSLCALWELKGQNLGKVLFEFGKRHVIQKLTSGTLVSNERLSLETSDANVIPCPFDLSRIPEPNTASIEISIAEPLLHSPINTSGGAYTQGNVQAGRDFIGRDKIEQHWHIHQALDDPEKQAVRSILSSCYRRSIFTKMHAQMNHEAMFQSISDAIRLIQPQIPTLASAHFQEITANIVAELDNIVRIGSKHYDYHGVEQINESKLQVLHLLLRLAEGAGLNFVIPKGRLVETTFFTKAEADEVPDYT